MCCKLPFCEFIARSFNNRVWTQVYLSCHFSALSPTGLSQHVWTHSLLCISFSSFQDSLTDTVHLYHCFPAMTLWSHCTFTIPKLFIETALHAAATALRGPLISLLCLCVNQWYMTTVFLTIVFVGASCVFNEREKERRLMYFEVRKGFVLKNNNNQTIKEQRDKKKTVFLSNYHWVLCPHDVTLVSSVASAKGCKCLIYVCVASFQALSFPPTFPKHALRSIRES